MMGTKVRLFEPLAHVSLEDLVPKDHFYRQVERTLDLSFVRDLVKSCYAAGGRPSVDPRAIRRNESRARAQSTRQGTP